MSTAEPTTRRARRTQAEPPIQADALPAAESPSTELSLPERALAAMKLTVTVDQLTELAAKTVDIQAITNNDGRTQAHAAAMVLKEQRLVIERAGKAAREDANKFAKQVIVEADKLIALISPEEERLIKLRDEWDAAREAEKRAKQEAERQRLLAIQQRIQDIRDMVADAAGKSAAQIGELIRTLTAIIIDDTFEQSKPAAEQVHANVLARLRSMQDQQARIEQERAEAAERERQRKIELEAEIAKQRQQRELNQLRLKRIAHINNLVLVATTGRSDRKAGTRECITETLAEVRALLINEAEFGDMLDAAIGARDAALQQIQHLLERFDERIRSRNEQIELDRQAAVNRDRMAEIQAIGHQVIIASTGRRGVRAGGTRECIIETLAETQAWPVGEDKFGSLAGAAHAARIRACEQIQALLEAFDERAEHARIAAENARQAEELRRQQEALEQQRREQDLERAELERQQQQLAATQVAHAAPATEPEASADSSTEQLQSPPADDERPSRIELVAVVANHWSRSQATAEEWLVEEFGGAA